MGLLGLGHIHPSGRRRELMSFESVIHLMEQLTPVNGANYTALPYVALFKETEKRGKTKEKLLLDG